METNINTSYFKLVFYTILSYLVYTYLFRPIFNVLYPIYYYQRFHCVPKNFLIGNIREFMPNFPIPSPPEDAGLIADVFFDNLVNTNSDRSISVIWAGPYPMVFASDHEAVEAIMNKSNQNVEKPFFYKFVKVLKEGLVAADVALWKVRRKAIEPFYVTKRQRHFIKTMDEEIKSLPKLLTQWIGKPVDIEHSIHLSSLNVIGQVCASIPLDDMMEEKEIGLDCIARMQKLLPARIINPVYWFEPVMKLTKFGKMYDEMMDQFETLMSKIFARRQQLLQQSPHPAKEDADLVHLLELQVDQRGIGYEILNAIAAGHETVATGLRWTLFLLGNHPDMQERLYREILDYFPDDEPVNDLDKLNQCTYLDQCLKESLRLFPPIHLFQRTLTGDVMVKGQKLLKGTMVFIGIKSTHRDPSVYPEPKKYDPERWSPENAKNIPRTAFIPFGYGSRNCIGYRYAMIIMKVYLVHILRKFSLKSTQKEDTIRTRCEVVLLPESSLDIIYSIRNKNINAN